MVIFGSTQLVKHLYCMCLPPTIINHFVAGLTNPSSRFQMPELINGQAYELVFSAEFEIPNRIFYPGDDPYWEAVDLWYGATNDIGVV